MIYFKSKSCLALITICFILSRCVSLEKYEAQQSKLEYTKQNLRSLGEENEVLTAEKVELIRKNIAINEQLAQNEQLLAEKSDSLKKQFKIIKANVDAMDQLSNNAKNDILVFQQMLGDMVKKFDDFQLKNLEQTKAIQRDIRKIQTETRKISDKLESANTNPQ